MDYYIDHFKNKLIMRRFLNMKLITGIPKKNSFLLTEVIYSHIYNQYFLHCIEIYVELIF